jgi:uncharacterized protein (DUF433 family)
MSRNGSATDEILEDSPGLTADDVEFAKLYLEAHPAKGRPSKGKVLEGSDETAPR